MVVGRAQLYLSATVLLLYAIHAAHWVWHGYPNVDEGFYALASREVLEGRLPYRDFAYTQAPLFPYLQGLFLRLVGYSLYAQRALNAVWGALTLLLVLRLAREKAPGSALWAPLSLALLPAWVYFEMLGKTYALAGLLLLLAGATLWVREPMRRALSFGLLGSLAVGCRIPVAPAVFVLWLFLIAQAETPRDRRWILLAPPLIGVSLALPFALADPQAFFYWNLQYHAAAARSTRLVAASQLPYHVLPLLALLGVAGLAAKGEWRVHFKEERAFLTAGLLGVAAQFLAHGIYAEYATPCLPLLALGVARVGQRSLRLGWPVALAGVIAVSALPFQPPQAPRNRLLVKGMVECTEFLRGRLQRGSTVLTPYPIVVTGAGLEVLPGLEMGYFGITDELSAERAARLKVTTLERLRELVVQRRADAIVLSRYLPNFPNSIPSCTRIPPERLLPFREAVREHYRAVFLNDDFLVLVPATP
jgi:4-amino-4-deoxy-L-arabinose transferase-like glycosyltransferase